MAEKLSLLGFLHRVKVLRLYRSFFRVTKHMESGPKQELRDARTLLDIFTHSFRILHKNFVSTRCVQNRIHLNKSRSTKQIRMLLEHVWRMDKINLMV